MKTKHLFITVLSLVILLAVSGLVYAQPQSQNPYSLDMKVYQNTQAINDLRSREAQLYLKLENLLVKYGEIKGQLEELSRRLTILEEKLNQTAPTVPMESLPSSPNKAKQQSSKKPQKININRALAHIKSNIEKQQALTKKHKTPKKRLQTLPPDELAYKEAKKVYDSGKYNEAIKLFKEFKKKFPKSAYVPNAIFYIAQSYYKKGEFDKAIINYDYLINTYPNSNKTPDATLKEGISFIKLGDVVDGKYLLEKVIQQYPNSPQAQAAALYLRKLSKK